MANNTIVVNAMTQGLSQVIREMTRLQQQLAATQSAANGASGAQNGQAGASRNQSRAANDAAESISRLNSQHTNVARQMSDMARSSSASIAIAYAEIGATVFTLAAAFNFLKNAAQYDNMLQAQRAFAQETGINLSLVAKKLQEASGYAIDFQKASSMASIGKTAGFTTDQMINIAKTAKTAAIILGRDLPDAIDRAFRGVAKGEPEILDELGIFIRLGPAYKEYAKGIKVAEDALTSFQQKQAIYAAFRKSGKIYESISDKVETDPFSKAQAQFMSSIKELTSVFTNFVSPFVNYLAENKSTLLALALFLGGKSLMTASKAMFNPTAYKTTMEGYKALLKADKETLGNISNTIANKTSAANMGRMFGAGLQSATTAMAGFNAMGVHTQSVLGKLITQVNTGKLTFDNFAKILNRPGIASGQFNAAMISLRDTGAASIRGQTIDPAAANKASMALAAYQEQMARVSAASAANAVQSTRAGLAIQYLSLQVQRAVTAFSSFVAPIKLVGIAMMSAITSIMSVAGIVYIAVEAIKGLIDLFGYGTKGAADFTSAITSGTKSVMESQKAIAKWASQKEGDLTVAINRTKAYAGALEALDNSTSNMIETAKKYKEGWTGDGIGMAEAKAMKEALKQKIDLGGPEMFDKLQASFMKSGTSIEQFNEEVTNIFDDNMKQNVAAFVKALEDTSKESYVAAEAARTLQQNVDSLVTAMSNYNTAAQDFGKSARNKTAVDGLITSYEALNIQLKDLYKASRTNAKGLDAQKLADNDLLSFISQNAEKVGLSADAQKRLEEGTMSSYEANNLMSNQLKYLNIDYVKLQKAEKAIEATKAASTLAITSQARGYGALGLNVDSLTSTYTNYYSKLAEVSKQELKLQGLNKAVGMNRDEIAINDTTKSLAALRDELALITQKDKSLNVMEQLYGKPVVEDMKAVDAAIAALVSTASKSKNKALKDIAEQWGIFERARKIMENFKTTTVSTFIDIGAAAEVGKKAIQEAVGALSELAKLRALGTGTGQNFENEGALLLSRLEVAYDIQTRKDNSAISAAVRLLELQQEMNDLTNSSKDNLSLMFEGYSSEVASAILAFQEDLKKAAKSAASKDTENMLSNILTRGGEGSVMPIHQAYADSLKTLGEAQKKMNEVATKGDIYANISAAEGLAVAEKAVAEERRKAIIAAETLAAAGIVVTQADKDLIKAHQDAREAIETTKTALQGFRDAISEIAQSLASVGKGKGWSAAGKDMKESAFKGLDKIKEKFSKDGGKALEGFGKNILGKMGGGKLGGLLKEWSGSGMLSGLANIAQGNKGVGAGQVFGALIGGPLGAMLGGMIGGAIFGQKVLKAVGIQAQINNFGELTAQEIAVYKKKGIGGSKTSTSILGSLASETMLALQDAITNIRSGFLSNINQLSVLSLGALTANEEAMKNFTYSGRFTIAPDSQDKNALYDALKKGYGDAMVNAIAPMIKQFAIANEGFANTLERLVHIVKVADNTFNTVFFKGTGKGLSSVLSGDFLANFSKEALGRNIDELMPVKQVVRPGTTLASFNEGFNAVFGDINALIGRTFTSLADITSAINANPRAFMMLKSKIDVYKVQYAQFAKDNALFIGYLTDPTNPLYASVRELAKLDFYNKMYASFSGANIEEKTKNFDAAMSKYSDAVGSSLESLAGQFSQLSLELGSTEGLPETVKAASNGVITPIYKFNMMLKDAINAGATPQEVAKAIEVGAKLSDVISNVLQVFSNINISSISTKTDFITNIISGVTDTFKTSLLEQFKKTLVSPILGGLLDGTGNVGLTAGEIANAGDSLVARAEELLAILNNQNTSSALGLVGVEFEKLMKLFASLDVATSLTNINKVISDISSDLRISAFDFLVKGDAYSTSLFKAADSFKKAGVSEDLIYQPLSVVFDKVRTMISSSSVTAEGINYLTEALKSMAEATKAARTQIANTVETTSNLVGSVFGSIKEISISMINSSGDIDKAKTILADLLTYPAEQVAKARSIYQKAKLSGNMLEIANAGSNLSTQLSSYMADQISAQETLSKLAEDKYNKEKAALDDIINWTKELADFAKELKFDEKLSILAPINRLAEATKTFDQLKQDLLLKSNSSSLTAEDVKSIQEDGKRLLELGREVYASGDQYTALYTQVQALIASSSLSLSANQATLEQSTLAYQDSSLLFAAQQRDIQLSTLEELKSIGERAAYDNAISTQLLDAIKFNQSVPSGVVLSDYYAQLLSQAQSGIGSFTGVGTGFPDFTQGTATQQQTDSATAPTTTDLNARLVQTLERLEVVLAMLPLDMRNAVINQQSAVKRS